MGLPKKSNNPITILLADDHTIVRECLLSLLNAENDFLVVGEACDGYQALLMAQTLKPAVIIMDVAMPKLNGIEALRQIHELFPDMKVIILSAYSDDAYVESVMELGASAYLIKQTSSQLLSKAVREVHRGKQYFSPEIAQKIAFRCKNSMNRFGELKTKINLLSSRETQVLQLLAEGLANKQIAASLNISIKTVEKHRSNLKQKLDIYDTAGLTCYAIRAGIIESSVQTTTLEDPTK